ncbi:hypothetical protein VTG60DRAFT_2303 [Thermothelomyces hinnuleus]
MDVGSKSDAEILDAAREEIGKNLSDEERSNLQFRMDKNEKSHIAVVIKFGSDGVVIVNGDMVPTGGRTGKYLYFTTGACIMAGKPDVYFLHQE